MASHAKKLFKEDSSRLTEQNINSLPSIIQSARDPLPLPKDVLSMYCDQEDDSDEADDKDLHMGWTKH